ncbi:Alpha/Beta hydrolase protein [Halteromyces radiatus]|uniref:Alpha/Beta hydrolase protein n=1 Tax=Halteromyces radiatus TaxID=101107 RepID=UPI00221E69E6|nr:Alpha/Beta hydrolase protein [Halteromyces radiatus]KAI8079843.1 Alpha/Beta hydrolase protein [Halteromyces radiatus]
MQTISNFFKKKKKGLIQLIITMTNTYTYVFIHGAMHGGWCFERKLIPLFKKANYRTITFDLPGNGKNDDTPIEEITLDNYAKRTISVIDEQTKPEEKVILVGHSLGGLTATMVAERIPDKIHCVVYLAAFYLQDGQTLVSANIPTKGAFYVKDEIYLGIDEDDMVDAFYKDCDEDDIQFAKANVTKQYLGPQSEKFKVQGVIDHIDKYYIKALHDKAIPPESQEMMYKNKINNVIEIDSAHSPFFSNPDELFTILTKLIK